MSRLQTKIRNGIKCGRAFPTRARSAWSQKKAISSVSWACLLLEHLLHVADFTLQLPAGFFCRPAIAQVWVPCCIARLFFHFAFRFPKTTLDFILCARFHKNKIAQCEPSGCEKLASFSPRPFDRLTVLRLDCHSYDNETQRRRHFLHLF